MLPYQEPGNRRERWIQNDTLTKRMLEEWNSIPLINYHEPGTLRIQPKRAKLLRSKAKLIHRIRCQVTRIDRHAAFTEPVPYQCGSEQSSKHTINDCPRWTQLRRPLMDKIPGPTTWENWLFTNLNVHLILQFAAKTNLLDWYEMDEEDPEE
ncbi:hypothetical protein P167DRAFT_580620 [Morchella conica CCBAS932]|uniref:Uncharacterized protein n=1 Tax=Morchella conica CCBAS932 TaxID=1392247 RepID=A0A3N4KA83_9PEZI|nr:hypothetical protein P167DRAFT_580620 [Morchella conica CCBAS932]